MPSTNNQVNLAATTYALYTTRTLTAQFSIRNTRPAYRLNQILRVHAVFVRHFLPTRGGGQQARKTRTFSHSRRPTPTTGNFSGHTPRKAGAGAGAADARPTGRGRGGVGGGGRPQLMRDAARPDRSRSNCSSNSSSSSVHSRSELAPGGPESSTDALRRVSYFLPSAWGELSGRPRTHQLQSSASRRVSYIS